MRVVLDTSVLVAGLRSQLGASNRLLMRVAEGRLIPLVTTAVFLEYEDVLLRAEHRLATGMSERDVAGFLAAFASAALVSYLAWSAKWCACACCSRRTG